MYIKVIFGRKFFLDVYILWLKQKNNFRKLFIGKNRERMDEQTAKTIKRKK